MMIKRMKTTQTRCPLLLPTLIRDTTSTKVRTCSPRIKRKWMTIHGESMTGMPMQSSGQTIMWRRQRMEAMRCMPYQLSGLKGGESSSIRKETDQVQLPINNSREDIQDEEEKWLQA